MGMNDETMRAAKEYAQSLRERNKMITTKAIDAIPMGEVDPLEGITAEGYRLKKKGNGTYAVQERVWLFFWKDSHFHETTNTKFGCQSILAVIAEGQWKQKNNNRKLTKENKNAERTTSTK